MKKYNKMSKPQVTIIVCLVIGIVLGLIACQDDSSFSPASSNTNTTSSRKTITFTDFSHKEQAYQPLIAAFQEQQPNTEIQFVPLDDLIDGSTSRLDKSQIAGLADTAILYSPPTVAEKSLFLLLDPLIDADNTFAGNEFWPNLRTGCPAGLPVEFYLGLIFYDRTMFAEQGISEPTVDWSWQDFTQITQELTKQDGSQTTRYGFLPPIIPSLLLQPLIAGALPDDNAAPESQAILNAIEWYTTLSNKNYLPDWSTETNPNMLREELINSGQAAMWYGTNSELVQYQSRFGESLGVVALPANGSPTTTTNVVCAAISAGTMQPDAAWQWVKFLAENMPTAVIPVQPAIAESSQYWQRFDDETTAVLRFALDHAWYNSGQDNRLLTVMEEVQTTLSEGRSLQVALADVEQLPTPTSSSPIESVPVAPPPLTPTGDIVVDFFSSSSDQAALENLAAAFNREHSDIQIQLHFSLGNIRPGQQIFRTNDFLDLFDCFFLDGGSTDVVLYGADRFYVLDPLLTLEEPAFAHDFLPEFLDAFRYDGQLYGLPVVSQSHLIYYNIDLLTQLGISLPTAEWTGDDLWAAAVEAAGHEEVKYGLIPFGASPLNDYGVLLAMRGIASSALIDLNSSPPIVKLDDPDFLTALKWIETLIADGVIPAPNEMNLELYSQLEAAVQNGQVTFWTQPIGDIEFPVGIVPPPIAPIPYLLRDVTGFVISKRAETPLGCWEWAKFLSAQPHILLGVPVRDSVANSDVWQNAIGAELQEVNLTSLARSRFQPFPNTLIQSPERPLWVWLQNAWVTSYITNEDPAPLLAEAQIKADIYLACLGSPQGSSSDMINRCALEADPNYLTPEQAREATLE